MNIIPKSFLLLLLLFYPLLVNATTCKSSPHIGKTYYVSNDGIDYKADGSRTAPWKTIKYALYKIPDGSTLIIKPGIYKGRVRIGKAFPKGLLIKAEYPYLTKLTHNQRVIALTRNASNITIEGFEITHDHKESSPLVVHIDGSGKDTVRNISLRNNIIHDSYNNDLLKINYGAENILVECNMFYNQGDSDEHIDVNSAANVRINDNLFFNDYKKSNRPITKRSSSFIVIKDSNGKEDRFLGSENIKISRNIFFNWQGSHGQGFILIGEDGKPYYEAHNIEIFNNLMLGNSKHTMRSPLMVKGAKNIKFFNNTVSGDLPSSAFAIRVTKERKNKKPENIKLFNNIWSDPTATMGQGEYENNNDFSDTLIHHLSSFVINNNVYWNGGAKLPNSLLDRINPENDKFKQNVNPSLNHNSHLITPTWQEKKQQFSDGSFSIREAFLRLIHYYGISKKPEAIINQTADAKTFPANDILNNKRKPPHSVGALATSNSDN